MLRVALSSLGLDEDILRHGVKRELFAMPLARNWRAVLRGTAEFAEIERPSLMEIADAARARWLVPRAERSAQYLGVTRDLIVQRLGS